MAGGVRALVMLARFCNHEGVQEQVLINSDYPRLYNFGNMYKLKSVLSSVALIFMME